MKNEFETLIDTYAQANAKQDEGIPVSEEGMGLRQACLDYVSAKDARIAELEARQIMPEMVHVAQMLTDGATSDEIALYLPLLLSAIIVRGDAS